MLRRRYGRSDGPNAVHDAMARELWQRGKIIVRGGVGMPPHFVILMKRGSRRRPDNIDTEGRGYYAPSLDAKKPETEWHRMTDIQLKSWLSNFRPHLRSV